MPNREREILKIADQRMWEDHEVVFQRLVEISPDASCAAFHLAYTPIRVLEGRTLAAAVRDGDAEQALRYLQTISGGQMAKESGLAGPPWAKNRAVGDRFAQLLAELRRREGPDPWPDGFDPRMWLEEWIRRPQPALGSQTPSDLLESDEGFESVRRVFGALWSGSYQ